MRSDVYSEGPVAEQKNLHQEIDHLTFLWNAAIQLHYSNTFNILTFAAEMVRNLAVNKDFMLA